MDIKRDFHFLIRLAKGMAAQFGEKCEVAIHDLIHDYESTIIIIENGQVTNRRVGDGPSSVVLEALKNGSKLDDHYNYVTKTQDGRVLKSTTIYLKDDQEESIIGILSINYDITDLLLAESIIKGIASIENGIDKADVIPTNVNDLLDALIAESYRYIGKPVATMTKEDKIRAIKFLDQKGALLIKKSGDRISKFYDISKYTLYNYLDSEAEI